MNEPILEYTQRAEARRTEANRLAGRDAVFANARLGLFLLVLAVLAAGIILDAAYLWYALVPAGGFLVCVVLHDGVIQAHRQMLRRVAFYEAGLQRARQRAPKDAILGPPPPADHPYAADLDLFGPDGLFAFLCTAQTAAGEHTLADWLLAPSPAEAVRTRQGAAAELQTRLDLREDLSGLATQVRSRVHPQNLITWAQAPTPFAPAWRWAFLACNVAFLASLGGWLAGQTPLGVTFIVVLGQAALARWLQNPVEQVTAGLQAPQHELPVLAHVIARLHRESYSHPVLQKLHTAMTVQQHSAARPIRHLARLGDWFDAHRNQIFAVIAWLLLWAPHFACAVESWRRRHGSQVAGWLGAVGELEALLSLAGYSYEHPEDTFAELVEGGPLFEGTGIGHPLLPIDKAVRNDVRLGPDQRLLIVSGSNMSGKSTLLRTIGSNSVLAWSGAPVRAKHLRISPLQVGATLRVQDSIHTGTSRFYAEVRRLKQIMDLAQTPPPLLFLLDEILAGTNSHDRAVGATAILEEFLRAGGIGLVTTHDLSLSDQAAHLGAKNVHFVDDLLQGALHFDYRMRPGVVQTSNALALMQAAGLYKGAVQGKRA